MLPLLEVCFYFVMREIISSRYLAVENQTDINGAFNYTSRYLSNLLNIDNIYFDQMTDQLCLTGLQLDNAN